MFLSVAASHMEMVVTRHRGRTFLTLRGPETRATPVDCPAEDEWVGIRLTLGTFIPALLPGSLSDRRDVTLAGASTRAFWLNGSAWEYPSFENAEVFIGRLCRKGIVVRDPIVDAVTHGHAPTLSLRSTQRRFLRSTGITYSSWRQIERARYATNSLRDAVSILDTVQRAGYFDQPHLARSLKRWIGQTPTEIVRGDQPLSFLYKTKPGLASYDAPMGRIIVTEFVSLDGVIEAPGGGEDYKHAGWTFAISRGDEGNQFKLKETFDSDALLLGRVTYEGFAASWPSRQGEFADKFNSMPKYVVSSTLKKADWNNSTILSGDVAAAVTKLKNMLTGNIAVHGSARLVQALAANDLIDELRLMVFPVILGGGKKLFGAMDAKKSWMLVSSQMVGDGVAIMIYEPKR